MDIVSAFWERRRETLYVSDTASINIPTLAPILYASSTEQV